MTNNFFADISNNNGEHVNIPSYASAGYVGIALKATEGVGFVDPFYAGRLQWVRDAHRHDLPVFHYHFARPEFGEPRAQADHFWQTVREHWRRPGDFVVVDLETGSPTEGNAWVQEYDRHLRTISGTKPVLYTYLSYLLSGGVTIPSRQVWLAAYGSRRPGDFLWRLPRGQKLWAWQYTDGAVDPSGLPRVFAGIGQSDGSIMNPSVARVLHKQRRPR